MKKQKINWKEIGRLTWNLLFFLACIKLLIFFFLVSMVSFIALIFEYTPHLAHLIPRIFNWNLYWLIIVMGGIWWNIFFKNNLKDFKKGNMPTKFKGRRGKRYILSTERLNRK
jgi:hypothetical protein